MLCACKSVQIVVSLVHCCEGVCTATLVRMECCSPLQVSPPARSGFRSGHEPRLSIETYKHVNKHLQTSYIKVSTLSLVMVGNRANPTHSGRAGQWNKGRCGHGFT